MTTVNINGVGSVNFPDDYTPERIKFAIENDILPRMRAAKAPSSAAQETAAFEAKIRKEAAPNKLERLGRGFADVTQGVTQGALMVKDAVTGGDEAAPYTAEKTDELARYEKGRGPDAGMDWMRLGGNVLATAPAALIPGAAAATVPLRAAAGAAQGAAASASMFTPEGESKLTQTMIGAGFGAAVPAVIEGGKRAITNLTRQMSAGQTVLIPQIQQELTLQLKGQGLDFNKLTGEVQRSLLEDAQKALKTGGALDPAQLARKADIESVGAKGTQAAVTRDPKDWRTQQNLRGVDNVGEGIAKRQADDATAMTDYLGRLRAKTGGAAKTPLEAGESVTGALRSQDAGLKSGVDKAYSAARDNLGRASPMDAATFSKQANLVLDDQMLGAYLPGEVRTMLNDVTAGKIPFNVNTAVQMDSVLSAAQRSAGKGSPQALAIGKVRDALNGAPIESGAGEDAKRAFDTARGMAKGRFQLHKDVPAMEAAVDDVAPDKFVKKFILDADAKTLRNTLTQLRGTPDGAQAVADVKGHLFDNLLLKATGATNVDDVAGRPFSGRNFAKALDSIAPEKLHQIFTPSEVEALRTLQRASKYLTEEVPFSDVNHSKTAAAIANILQKIGSTPMLGQVAGMVAGPVKLGLDWAKDATARKQVAEFLLTSAAQKGKDLPLTAPGKLQRLAPAGAASAFARPGDERN